MNKPNKDKHLSDEDIIELYWNRDERAIEETDLKYRRYLYAIAYNIVHDDPDCEECLNDTYLGVWNRIPPTRPNVFSAFIGKIMRNIAIDKYRSRMAHKRQVDEIDGALEEFGAETVGDSSIDDAIRVREVARILSSYLRDQSKRREFVFVCRYYYCDKVSDIAKMLGVSEATVYRELTELRRGLLERLEEEGYEL